MRGKQSGDQQQQRLDEAGEDCEKTASYGNDVLLKKQQAQKQHMVRDYYDEELCQVDLSSCWLYS